MFPLEDPVYLPLLKSFFFSLPEDEERNLSAGLDNVIELMVEAESEGEEGVWVLTHISIESWMPGILRCWLR